MGLIDNWIDYLLQVMVPLHRQLLRSVHMEVGADCGHVHDSCVLWGPHRDCLHH